MLITDHNVRETLGICDHAYIISDGRVLAQGTPAEIVDNADVRRCIWASISRMCRLRHETGRSVARAACGAHEGVTAPDAYAPTAAVHPACNCPRWNWGRKSNRRSDENPFLERGRAGRAKTLAWTRPTRPSAWVTRFRKLLPNQ